MNRRALLSTVPIALTSATAGCMASLTDSDPGGIRISTIAISNAFEEPQIVNLRLERDGEIVLWDAVEVGAEGEEIIDGDWSTEPAKYRFLFSAVEYIDMHEYDGDDAVYDCNHIMLNLLKNEPDGADARITGLENPSWGDC